MLPVKVFILIIMIIGSNGRGAVTTQEFTSEDSCKAAQEQVHNAGGWYAQSVATFCVEK